MTTEPSAQDLLRELADRYIAAGYPHYNLWYFTPGDDRPAAFGELRALGYIEPQTNAQWGLTQGAVDWIMEQAGDMSSAAMAAMTELADLYVARNYPSHNLWYFTPEDTDRATLGELRARGYIEQQSASQWGLTQHGVNWILAHKRA
jgi:hypothetical protein